MKKRTVLCTALAASMLCAAPVSLHWPADTSPTVAVDSADARLGGPLTPMSVCGREQTNASTCLPAITTAIRMPTELNWVYPI
jgi:hypothetical protein